MTDKTPLGNDPLFAGGLQEVAERTWAWIQPNGELGESNAGLLAGDGAAVLVDTLWDERLTARMLEAMAPVTAAAGITTLVNTHGDGDHWYGNGLLSETVEIVATEAAAEQMREEPPSMLTRMRPLPAIAGIAGRVPLNPAGGRLRGLARFGSQLAAYEFGDIEPRLPDTTFGAHHLLEAGGRELELFAVGPAHTAGDAIAWAPDVRVVFSGDIVFNGVTPIMWAGPASNWRNALAMIGELDPAAIVPGHGPVAGSECLEPLLAYWHALEGVVAEDGGSDPFRLARDYIASSDYADAPWGSWLSPERTLVNVAMIAREQTEGETGPVSTAKRIALISAMGELAAERAG